MRRTGREGQAHALGGHTTILFQRQTLGSCAKATLFVTLDKEKRLRHKYLVDRAE